MREAVLLAAVIVVPPLWGGAMYWIVARLWRERPRQGRSAPPPAGPPAASLTDYQI